jgi:hypothetical protein
MPWGVTDHCKREFSGKVCDVNFFERCLVLPLYALPFGFWFIMIESGFIPGDDVI